MLSSSVVCLSFTVLNTFENKKGIIKILVYSSVIDIYNQMDVIFFTIILVITSGQEQFAKLGCFTHFDEIVTDFL